MHHLRFFMLPNTIECNPSGKATPKVSCLTRHGSEFSPRNLICSLTKYNCNTNYYFPKLAPLFPSFLLLHFLALFLIQINTLILARNLCYGTKLLDSISRNNFKSCQSVISGKAHQNITQQESHNSLKTY